MKLRNLLSILLVFFTASVIAQPRLITCSSEQNPVDRSINVFADSQAFGDYTVKLIYILSGFSTNATNDVALTVVNRGHSTVGKLTFDKSANIHSFAYTYQSFPGTPQHKIPDTSFTYLLPVTENNSLRTFRSGSVSERLGTKPDGYIGVDFMYKLGDTICAARAGIVYECSDEVKESEKIKQVYNSERNKVSIEHKDGTLSHYSILAPIKLLVQAGDYVIPGQPIAVFANQSVKYDVLFSVSYLDEKKLYINTEKTPQPAGFSSYNFLHVPFYVDGKKAGQLEPFKEYTSSHPKEIIGAEMSKKDKKKLGL